MTRRFGWVLFSLLLTAGCIVQTKDPLSDPQKAEVDKSLLGHWILKSAEESEEVDLFIGRNSETANPSALLEFTTVGWNRTSEQLSEIIPKSYATPTKIGNGTYLSVIMSKLNMDVPTDKPFSYKAYAASDNRRFCIVRYECDGKKLRLWVPENDAREKLVKSGQLKSDGKLITSESLVKYLTDNGGETLFSGKSSDLTKVP